MLSITACVVDAGAWPTAPGSTEYKVVSSWPSHAAHPAMRSHDASWHGMQLTVQQLIAGGECYPLPDPQQVQLNRLMVGLESNSRERYAMLSPMQVL